MDVVRVFLHGFLEEIIYTTQPHFFDLNPKLICRPRKALYRLKQAPQVKYQALADFFRMLGFEHIELDNSVFVPQDRQLFLAIYVDSLLLFDTDNSRLTDTQANSALNSRSPTDKKYPTTLVWR